MRREYSSLETGKPIPTLKETLVDAAFRIDQQEYRIPELDLVLGVLNQAITPPLLSQDQINRLRRFHRIAVELDTPPVTDVDPNDPSSIAAMVVWIEGMHDLLYRLYWGNEVPHQDTELTAQFLYTWARVIRDSPNA